MKYYVANLKRTIVKVKSCKADYLVKAQSLSIKKAERLMSRMSIGLQSQLLKDGVSVTEMLGIQLEIEEEQLNAWRKMVAYIRKNDQPIHIQR